MITNLNETVEVFSSQIKDKFADYSSLYNYFCMFINENYTDKDGDLQEFFTRNLCRRDIINSCVYYMEESNASSVSAIEKYLNSITKLYNEYIKPLGWSSAGLDPILPFSTCKGEVREKINKSLREKRKFLALKEEEYINLIEYLGKFQKKTYVGKQIS
ncbi:MAG: hypothetical protein PHS74_12820, partial [Lachnospiraceae bacterium]|nr:hypothetical protein [Lachnospiraceae bacterium]